MKEKLEALLSEVQSAAVGTQADLEAYKRKFTNKKGAINDLFAEFRTMPGEVKRELGRPLNELKKLAQERLAQFEKDLKKSEAKGNQPHDLFLPGDAHIAGARHPLSIVRNRIIKVFAQIGFTVAEGPEVEDDWHNFGALNFPDNHPARDMQDTFFVSRDPDYLLRTHTSSVQVRVMEKEDPPMRVLSPGRVYRNEA
ncbi:MAG: phenylalanine--tRNA ligase subunit alpha, partial [Bacteroidota bacterium]